MSETEQAPEVSVQAMDDLVEKMFLLRADIEERKSALTELNKELARLQAKAVENLKALDRSSYSSSKGSVGITKSWRFNLPQTHAEKAAAFKHFKDKGGAELLYDFATINSNKYSSYCNTEWELAKEKGDGMEYRAPHGGEATLFETVTMRKKT